MKTIYLGCALMLGGTSICAQQVSVTEMARLAKFTKTIDEINNGKQKIKYSDIQGIPYYYSNFLPAKIGDTSTILPIRYNIFLDTIEILNDADVYEVPKENAFQKFTFETTKETLVLASTVDENSGYFFELVKGKNQLLKKLISKFHPEVPAPNTMMSGTPAKFTKQDPVYYIKTKQQSIKIPKNIKDLPSLFPDKKNELEDFIKSNKVKIKDEASLISLVNFLNK